MNLHNTSDKFNDLVRSTHIWLGIDTTYVKRDYYIVLMLQNLAKSEYAQECVFKGGTSLSKCYPGSIERIMTAGGVLRKLPGSRNNRNKTSIVMFPERDMKGIKLEIGSTTCPSLARSGR